MKHHGRLLASGLAAALLGSALMVPSGALADDVTAVDPETPGMAEQVELSAEDAVEATQMEEGSTASMLENPQHMWVDDDANAQDGEASPDTATGQPRARARAAAADVTWTTVNGLKTARQGNGTTFASPALKVIDVSEWQGDIDWNKVKQSGVDAAILRLGYCNNLDARFVANLNAVRKAGIPYGIYLYSYAPDAKWAAIEANFVAQQIRKYNLTDMAFPVYYDLEEWNAWKWDGETLRPPTTPAGYLPVVNTFVATMRNAGYSNVRLYSYLSYFTNELADSTMQAKAGWVAHYNANCGYTFPNYSSQRGWQYSSSQTVNGISGYVDMSAFDKVLFTDVNFRTPHYDDIVWLQQNKIATGYADGTFGGMRPVVRQDMAAFLRREAAKRGIKDAATWKPSAADWNTFTDVDKNTPHAEDILWLAHAGIAEGYDNGTFGGMVPMYRQDMAAFLYRLAEIAGKQGGVKPKTDFTDVDSTTPHYQEIQWLGDSGIAQGYRNANGTYRFGGTSTIYRQDMAAFLHRLDGKLA